MLGHFKVVNNIFVLLEVQSTLKPISTTVSTQETTYPTINISAVDDSG